MRERGREEGGREGGGELAITWFIMIIFSDVAVAAGISIYSYKCPKSEHGVVRCRRHNVVVVVVMVVVQMTLPATRGVGWTATIVTMAIVSPPQASRLKMGRRMVRELSSAAEGGGEEDGRETESTSEQKDPEREVSAEELRAPEEFLAPDMLKYLLSCLTAPAMSEFGEGKFQDMSEDPLFDDGPPYIGSCLIGPVTFFSGSRSGLFCISSRAWMK